MLVLQVRYGVGMRIITDLVNHVLREHTRVKIWIHVLNAQYMLHLLQVLTTVLAQKVHFGTKQRVKDAHKD